MKRIIALSILALFAGNIIGQEISQRNVPAVVLNAFQLKFSNATEIRWTLEKGNYHVDFEVNNKENELIMSDKGIILRHLQDLYVSEIPEVVLGTIKSKDAFFDVSDADRLEEGGKISYRINFWINENNHEFNVDKTGRLMKYTKELKISDVPSQIVSQINTKYAPIYISDALFTEENGKITYMINGWINHIFHTFLFDDKASVLKHVQFINNSEVPVPIINAVKASYSGFEIRSAKKTEEGGDIIYDLEMRNWNSRERVNITINSDGKILEVKTSDRYPDEMHYNYNHYNY